VSTNLQIHAAITADSTIASLDAQSLQRATKGAHIALTLRAARNQNLGQVAHQNLGFRV
jgi:hypothetical protein